MSYLFMQGITKTYPGVLANAGIDFRVERGEIHALVGENGAGKSTLMKILYGLEQPASGQIFLEDRPVSIPNPNTAIHLGIGMVHQHFQLVPSLTVAENIALGLEPRQGLFVRRDAMHQRVEALSEKFGLKVDPRKRVEDLSVGLRQRVEILKLLYREAKLLILDEPTAVLTPQEVDGLFEVIRKLVDSGCTAVFITHKLREVMSICQKATVLRRGKVVGNVNVAESSPTEIARMMVGAELESVQIAGPRETGAVRLSVRDLSADDDRGLPALRGISFDVREGEIVGLAGVEGNGQHELLETLVGLRHARQGEIILNDRPITRLPVRKRREAGLALIPEDRNREGLSGEMAIWENMIANQYYQEPQSRYGVMALGRIRRASRQLMTQFDVRAPNEGTTVKTLSGGNAQKIVVAREIGAQPSVLIGAQPSRGLDVGATQFVHRQLLQLREAKVAILIISADLDELFAICDRFIVLFEGRIIGNLVAREATREQLGLLMAGRGEQGAHTA